MYWVESEADARRAGRVLGDHRPTSPSAPARSSSPARRPPSTSPAPGPGAHPAHREQRLFRHPAREGHWAGPFLDLLATAGATTPRCPSGRATRQVGAQRQTGASAAAAGRASRCRAGPKRERSRPRRPAGPAVMSSPDAGDRMNDRELVYTPAGSWYSPPSPNCPAWGRPVRAARRSPFPAIR